MFNARLSNMVHCAKEVDPMLSRKNTDNTSRHDEREREMHSLFSSSLMVIGPLLVVVAVACLFWNVKPVSTPMITTILLFLHAHRHVWSCDRGESVHEGRV